MANPIWLGTALDGNFTNAANYDTGIAPVNTDSVRVSATAVFGMTTNLTQTSLDLTSFVIEKGFGYDIGGAGNYLSFACATVIDNSDGENYIQASHTGANNIDKLIVDKDFGNFYVGDGTDLVSRLDVVSGDVFYYPLNAGGTIVNVGMRAGGTVGGRLTFPDQVSGFTTTPTLNINGGQVTMDLDDVTSSEIFLHSGSLITTDMIFGADVYQFGGVFSPAFSTQSEGVIFVTSDYFAMGGVCDVRNTTRRMAVNRLWRWPNWTLHDLTQPKFDPTTTTFIGQ